MARQSVVIIGNKAWGVIVLEQPSELTQGLGGLSSLEPGTGALFILPFPQVAAVTTVPMLFPLDIVFIRQDLTVASVFQGVQPGLEVTSNEAVAAFLEVNSGEASGVVIGDTVQVFAQEVPLLSALQQVSNLVVQFMPLSVVTPLLQQMFSSLTLQRAPLMTQCLWGVCQKIKPTSQEQTVNLSHARKFANMAVGREIPVVPTSFDKSDIGGATDGTVIYIARWRLNRWDYTKDTIAHEAAHVLSGNGKHSPLFEQKYHELKKLEYNPKAFGVS